MPPRNNNRSSSDTVVTKAMLLSMARATGGFRGVKTEMIQAPTADNNRTAIFHATVTMADGAGVMTYDGTADAGPHNQKENMVRWAVATAETRAVVRALKWAVGAGGVAMEEMEDYDATAPAVTPSAARASAAMEGEMTPAQRECIEKLSTRKNYALPEWENWTARQAGDYIKQLDALKAV